MNKNHTIRRTITSGVLGAGCLFFAVSAQAFDINTVPPVGYHPSGISYGSAPFFANAMAIDQRNWIDEDAGWLPIRQSSGQLSPNGYPLYLDPGQVLRTHGIGMEGNYRKAVTWPDRDAFYEGRVGIGYIGTWMIAEGEANFPDFADDWDYAWLPSQEGDSLFVADSGWGLVVSPNSPHQDVAWDFAKFATTNFDNALQWNLASGTIPALPEVAESDEIATEMPWVAKALDLLPYGSYLGNMPDRDLVIYDILFPHLLNVFQGLETIDDGLKAIDAEANATFE